MSNYQIYENLFLCHPDAFFLLSYLDFLGKKYGKLCFGYFPEEIRGIGRQPSFKKQKVFRLLKYLELGGYIKLAPNPHIKNGFTVTLLMGEITQ